METKNTRKRCEENSYLPDYPMIIEQEYNPKTYYIPCKRLKIIEQFDAMSLDEDEFTADTEKPVFMDTNQLKSKYDCYHDKNSGKRKRTVKQYGKCSIEKFSSLQEKPSTTKVVHHCKRKDGHRRRRSMKDDYKQMAVATLQQASLSSAVLKFITMSRDCFPKLYEKLVRIYQDESKSSSCAEEEFLSQRFAATATFTQREATKIVVNKFLKKVNQCSIQANSKITNEVVASLLRRLEQDIEMAEDEMFYGDNDFSDMRLAIMNCESGFENYHYIDISSNCIIEEVD